MSPVSRGRKQPKSSQSSSELDGAFADMLRDFLPLAGESDPFQVELFTSELIGEWWKTPDLPADPERTFGLGLIRHAGRSNTPAAVALLRAMAALGVTGEQRTAAAQAADALAGRGLAEPSWVGEIGVAQPHEVWALTDVYGDSTGLLLTFDRAGQRHGLLAMIDHNHLGGYAEAAFCTEEPDEALRDMRAQAEGSEGIMRVDRLDPAAARGLIESGLIAADASETAPDEDLVAARALVMSRCRLLPEPAPAAEAEQYDEHARAAIVDEFLATQEDPDEDYREAARLIVDYGCDVDGGRPLRVGPGKLGEFLELWVPEEVEPSEEVVAVLPDVVRDWASWAADRNGFDEHATENLLAVIEDSIEQFEEGPEPDRFAESYVDGLPEDADEELIDETVARRRFAVPITSAAVGVDEFPELDPADPDERYLLVLGEHPEYHDALADPEFDGEIDGVDPHLYMAVKQILIEQLWQGEPAEIWPAVVRLAEAGQDRDDILDELAPLVLEYLVPLLTGEGEPDHRGYAHALSELG